jgi:hypothetical protein
MANDSMTGSKTTSDCRDRGFNGAEWYHNLAEIDLEHAGTPRAIESKPRSTRHPLCSSALAMPGSTKGREARRLCVSIVSNNDETRDGLEAYFTRVGVPARRLHGLDDLGALTPDVSAAVIFPDDFAEDDVVDLMKWLRRSRPRLLVLLVTRRPNRFRDAIDVEGPSPAPILLPRPTFGWDILDAIRAHTGGADASDRQRRSFK